MTRTRILSTTAAVCGLLTVGLIAPSAADAAPKPNHAAAVLQQDIDALAADGFPGVEASYTDGRTTRDLTAGVADLTTGAPVPTNGRVRIASNTKSFTATVVLQLVAEKKVSLDAPIERYLPGVVRGDGIDGRKITVRELLQHTSGLPDYDNVLYQEWRDSDFRKHYTPQQLLDAAFTQPALAAPGAAFSYSNTNFTLAGMLVEKVTRHSLGSEITSRVIDRIGLHDTYWPADGDTSIRGAHAQNYLQETAGGPIQDITELDPSLGGAAGQLISTPRDLTTFFSALIGGELLPAAQLAEMEKTVPASDIALVDADNRYGLGLASFTLSCGGTAWTHGGDLPGSHTREAVTSDGRGVAIAVTGDPANPDPTDVRQFVALENAVDDALCA